ncbi:MAG: hypothetical protein AAF721_19815 [Myxococcota bacterium]
MLKKIAIAFAVLVALGVGVVAWLWHQATALPDWYVEEQAASQGASDAPPEGDAPPPQWVALDQEGNRLEDVDPIPLAAPEPSRSESDALLEAVPPKNAKKKATKKSRKKAKRHELRGFHRRAGKRRKGGKSQPVKGVKASRAVYEDGELEMGVIVDLANFPKEKLSERDRARFDRAIRNFPALSQRNVWVGVEDRPVTVDGYLQLGADAQVRVGKLRYSLSGAASRLGMKPAQLRAELNRELRRLGLVDPDA